MRARLLLAIVATAATGSSCVGGSLGASDDGGSEGSASRDASTESCEAVGANGEAEATTSTKGSSEGGTVDSGADASVGSEGAATLPPLDSGGDTDVSAESSAAPPQVDSGADTSVGAEGGETVPQGCSGGMGDAGSSPLALSTASLSFDGYCGSAPIPGGGESFPFHPPATFTITNVSADPVTWVATVPDAFSVDVSGSTLPPDAGVTVTVSGGPPLPEHAPLSYQIGETLLTIRSTSSDGAVHCDSVKLQEFANTCVPAPGLQANLDFGSVPVGSQVQMQVYGGGSAECYYAATCGAGVCTVGGEWLLYGIPTHDVPTPPNEIFSQSGPVGVADGMAFTIWFAPRTVGPVWATASWNDEDGTYCGLPLLLLSGAGVATDGGAGDAQSGMDSGQTTVAATAVAVAADFACAVTTGGRVECWGNGGFGSYSPAVVPGVTALSAGGASACAITASGGVECWDTSSVPAQVSGLTSGATAVSIESGSACAIISGGAVECWGDNTYGELGNNSTISNSSVPVQVSGLSSGATTVSTGGDSACAITTDGAVMCWGNNGQGELGNDSTTNSSVPVQVSGLSSGAIAVSAGGDSACAITSGGALKCWGDNSFGKLGNGSMLTSLRPVQVTGLASGVTAVSMGEYFACAITASGGVECWGDNTYGELGDDSVGSSAVPVQVGGVTSGAIAVSVGEWTACALTSIGRVLCWGSNYNGLLGDNATGTSYVPVEVSGF